MTRRRRSLLALLAALALALIVVLLLFDWNWLKGPLERQISSRLGRPFEIAGDLDVDLGLRPRITVHEVRLANPDWASDQPMLAVQRAEFVVDLPALWHGRLELPEVSVSAPTLRLETRPDGPPNWQLKQGPDQGPPAIPEIGRLQITDAAIHYLDHGGGRALEARLEQVAGAIGPAAGARLSAKGELARQPLELKLEGPPLAKLEPPAEPHQLALDLRLGESDLAGSVELDLDRKVPAVSARLHSERVATGELAGLLGAAAASAPPAPEVGKTGLDRLRSALGKLDFERLPELEADLDYQIGQLEGPDLALQDVKLRAGLHDRLPRLALEGGGRFKGGPVTLDVKAGPGEGAGSQQPRYRVDAEIEAGKTRITATGAVDDPERLQGLHVELAANSPDLAEALGQVGIEVPKLPGLQLKGQLVREGEVWRLGDLYAQVGESDLSGKLEADLSHARPLVTADLHSDRLRAADFMPAPADEQKAKDAAAKAESKLPSLITPAGVNLGTLPKLDADLKFTGANVQAPRVAFDQLQLDLKLREQVAVVHASGKGQFRDFEPVNFEVHAGSDDSLKDPQARYPIDLALKAGDSEASAKGSADHPLATNGLDLDVALKGPDLQALGKILHLSLPATPPYDLKARVTHQEDEQRWNLVGIRGTIADSDLGGNVSLELAGERPAVIADLTSKRLDFDDLGVLVGAPPDTQPGETASGQQRQEAAAAESKPNVLPDKPFNVPDLQAVDARIKFEAETVQARKVPLQRLTLELTLKNGKLHIEPLRLKVADGELDAVIDLAGREGALEGDFDLSLKQIRLNQLLSRLEIKLADLELEKEGVGTFGGRARLSARGNSIHRLAASADGELAIVMGGGQINALIVEGLGLDVGEALGLILTEKKEGRATMVPMQCSIGRFGLQGGVMRAQALVLETSDSTITGKGQIDLGKEALDIELLAHPKDTSVLTASTPVRIEGTFKHPKVDLISEELKEKSLAALALGVVLPVVGAILPFFEPGETKDSNCGQLIKDASAAMPPPPSQAPQ